MDLIDAVALVDNDPETRIFRRKEQSFIRIIPQSGIFVHYSPIVLPSCIRMSLSEWVPSKDDVLSKDWEVCECLFNSDNTINQVIKTFERNDIDGYNECSEAVI